MSDETPPRGYPPLGPADAAVPEYIASQTMSLLYLHREAPAMFEAVSSLIMEAASVVADARRAHDS